jgi:2'-5' RNA ligase
MRLFFAIKIPKSPELQAVAQTLRGWSSAVRVVDPDQWHLTLRFLGDTDSEQQTDLKIAAADIASRVEPFTLSTNGIGAFSRRGQLSVIWIGIAVPPELQQLHDELERAAVTIGFLPDRHPFRPHLTLGRLKSKPPIQLRRWLDSQENIPYATVAVESLALIQSELTPQGSIYATVQTWPLTGE